MLRSVFRSALLSFMLLPVLSSTSHAQVYVNGININELPVTYCFFDPTGGPLMNSQVYVQANYGQVEKAFSVSWVTDQHGNRILFNSEVDAMNHLAGNGWNFVDIIIEPDKSFPERIFIFQRSPEFVQVATTATTHVTHECLGFLLTGQTD